jgi:arginine N-succinyltransferase
MMLFRRAKKEDLEGIYQLADHEGTGITTLPKDKKILEKRLIWSNASFKKQVADPKHEFYLFVLEDPDTGQIVGTSAIDACVGVKLPFYSYKISKTTRLCHSLNIRNDYETLNLVNDKQGCSEICTLFLDAAFRKRNNGLLLSLGRFLFMANHPNRFSAEVVAEMRGFSDADGHSPFWDHVGYHFFHISFKEADRLTISTNKQFIADLMPNDPIPMSLLDKKAQNVIGRTHPNTLPAMNILLREGFRFNNYVDIFDGGPTLEVPLEEIKTIANSQCLTVESITKEEIEEKPHLIANTILDHRSVVSEILYNDKQKTCILSQKAAELLQVKTRDRIRIAPILPKQTKL